MSKKRKAIVKLSDKVRSLLDFKEEKELKDEAKKFKKRMADDLDDASWEKSPSMLSRTDKDPAEMNPLEYDEYLDDMEMTEAEYYDDAGFNVFDESGMVMDETDRNAFFSFDPEDAGRYWQTAGNAENLIEYMETKLNTPKELRAFMKGLENEIVDYGDDLKPYEDSENERIAAVAKARLEEMIQLKPVDREPKKEGSEVKGFTRKDLTPELLSLLDKQELKGFESEEITNDVKAIEESLKKFTEANDKPEMFPYLPREPRENFRIGGLLKTVIKKLKPEEAEEVSTKADDIHNVIEESINAGAKKKDVFNAVSDVTGLKKSEIAAIERIYAREAGGGKAVNLFEDLKMTYKALTTPRTAGQEVGANIGGPGTKTRATREAQGEYGLGGIGVGLTAGIPVGAAGISLLSSTDKLSTNSSDITNITEGTMDEAFSLASRTPSKYVFMDNGVPKIMYKGKEVEYSMATEEDMLLDLVPRKTKKAMGSLLSYE